MTDSACLQRLEALEARVAAFNPKQPRDKFGRWIEIGSLVRFRPGRFGEQPEQIGEVTGFGPMGDAIVQTPDGGKQAVRGDRLEVVDAIAQLAEPEAPAPTVRDLVDTYVSDIGFNQYENADGWRTDLAGANAALQDAIDQLVTLGDHPTPEQLAMLSADLRKKAQQNQAQADWSGGHDVAAQGASNAYQRAAAEIDRLMPLAASGMDPVRVLQAAAALTAAKGDHISSQPLKRTAADQPGGGGGKGGGRHVASKAGEKRYGLPIGTPLGQGKSGGKQYDRKTAFSYNRVMAGKTPAEIKENAGRMSTEELQRAAKALFSFSSKNERDNAARMALVRELADRGIDAHKHGYKGAPVVVNPNPKADPTKKADAAKAKDKAKAQADKAANDQRLKQSAEWFQGQMANLAKPRR